MIVRLNSQQDFEAFWQIMEQQLNQLCRLQAAIKLDRIGENDKECFLLKLQPIRQQDLFALLTIVAEICGQFILQHCCQRLLQKTLLSTVNRQYTSIYQTAPEEKENGKQRYEKKQKELAASASQELEQAMRYIDLEFENKLNLELLKYMTGQDGKTEVEIRPFFAQCLTDPLQLYQDTANNWEQLVFDPLGYFNFRLSFFKPLAQKAVFAAVSKDMETEEYQQLLETLRNFLKLQKPVTPVLHIIVEENGNFMLLDEKGYIIREQEIITELEMAQELGCGYDDTLATAIISLAPERIVFHHHPEDKQNQAAKKSFKINPMIQDIVEQKIQYCCGCPLCENITPQKEKNSQNKRTQTIENKKEYQLTRP